MLDACRRSDLSCLLLVFLILMTGLASSFGLETQAQPLPETFGEVVDVRVVDLEVVVEDAEGNRVHGLGPDDFALYVDGRETPIEFYTEVREGQFHGVVETENSLSAGPEETKKSTLGTYYLLFLDEKFSPGWSRNRILKSMRQQIDSLGPADRMAVVAFDGRHLQMLSDWTGPGERLSQVLDQAANRRPTIYRPQRDEWPAPAINRPYEQADGFSSVGVFTNGSESEVEIQRRIDHLRRTQLAVEAALRGFSSVPGRKVMLLTAGDWPFFPAQAELAASRPTVGLGRFDGGEEFWGRLFESANRFGFTLYPIDAGRPSVFFAFDDGTGPKDWGHKLREAEHHATLYTLAEETGGRAFVEGRAQFALEEVVADTRSFYWLGFSPAQRYDDRQHDIRVRVVGQDLRVRHRSGFLDRSRASEVEALLDSAELTGRVPSAGSLTVELGEPRRRGLRDVEVPLKILIPSDGFVFLRRDGQYRSDLELRFLVVDADDGRTARPIVPVRVRSEEAPEAGAQTWYKTTLQMRRSDHRVIIMLFDPIGGTVLSAIEELKV